MNDLFVFETELERHIKKASRLRPFVCDGSPFGCDVFIVGFNPATEMSEDFWKYWRPGEGFDKGAWLADYENKRREEGRPALSNTRRVLKWIGESLGSVRILETNLYWQPTRKARELRPEQCCIEPFK